MALKVTITGTIDVGEDAGKEINETYEDIEQLKLFALERDTNKLRSCGIINACLLPCLARELLKEYGEESETPGEESVPGEPQTYSN